MHVLPLLALMCGAGGWLPCLPLGARQLFVRPRRYRLLTLGFGVLQMAAFWLAYWLLIESRGIQWAP
jgi:hypothetical protein